MKNIFKAFVKTNRQNSNYIISSEKISELNLGFLFVRVYS